MDVAKLVRVHLKIREALAAKRKAFEAEEKELKDQQAVIEAQMLQIMNEQNIHSVRTAAGTFFRQEDIIPQAADWGAFDAFVLEHGALDFFERRLKKGTIKQYMDDHGQPPPGVNVFRRYEVRVRRPSQQEQQETES